MKITIIDTILSGNMGDGWKDQHDAANGYAEYAEKRLIELAKEIYSSADIEADIDVEYASGWKRELSVVADGGTTDECCEAERQLQDHLIYHYGEIWDEWCSGEGSDYFDED
ncbi:hypothetical protein [Desulfuromonas acetoxidans]|uniref:hypothetical protein n=1 Tax=Desulfuromonas acetoxidans TaxID=891 RepID=UPI00293011B5|nr:hypothetical protein [Desulfuromonas acetoxidans]